MNQELARCRASSGAGSKGGQGPAVHRRRAPACSAGRLQSARPPRLASLTHYAVRPEHWYETAMRFLLRALRVPDLLDLERVAEDPAAATEAALPHL